jgi:hypothetical protein
MRRCNRLTRCSERASVAVDSIVDEELSQRSTEPSPHRAAGRPLAYQLALEYRDAPDEARRSDEAIQAVKQALARLGGIVPPGMTRALPNGARVHYAGFLPMSQSAVGHDVAQMDPSGNSRPRSSQLEPGSRSRRPRTSPSPSWLT